MSIYEFGSDASGLHFTIEAVVNAAGDTEFKVHMITGSMNLNALYWSDGDAVAKESTFSGFSGAKSENSLNMNGANVVWNDDGTSTTSAEVYDGGVKLSDAGLGKGDGSTFLTAGGEDYQFTVADLDLSLFSTLGVRATSTSTAEGSIKWQDDTPYNPPPVDEPLAFDGLSQGAWKTDGGNGAGDWSETNFLTTDEYDDVFDVTAGGNIAGDSLLEVLDQKVQGNDEAILGKQAVAALLNADSDGEATLTQDYRFTTDEVIKAVQEVYDDGGFDAQQGADLANLLEFWNIAPENNTGLGATVPGELHEDDTTTIATTLEFVKEDSTVLDGGSFEGDIFQVLNTLHPGHDWDVMI